GTNAVDLLENSVVAANGGFQFDVTFLWDGTTNQFATQKVIDYAGTESLQFVLDDATPGVAQLFFQFDDNPANSVSTTIQANTWYQVIATFDTQGNPV